MGFVFLILLAVYMWQSIRWSRDADSDGTMEVEQTHDESANTVLVIVKLLFGILLVVAASSVLIPAVKIVAERVKVPESIIAATLVAFGTSLPEFVTAVTAARRGTWRTCSRKRYRCRYSQRTFCRWRVCRCNG